MSAVFGQKYTYNKCRTIGFMHFGQKIIIATVKFIDITFICVCLYVYACVCIYVCVNVHGAYVIAKLHKPGNDLPSSRPLYQMPAQLQEMVPLTRKSYHLHTLPVIQDAAHVPLLHQAPFSFPAPKMTFSFLPWIHYLYTCLLPMTKQKAPWEYGP